MASPQVELATAGARQAAAQHCLYGATHVNVRPLAFQSPLPIQPGGGEPGSTSKHPCSETGCMGAVDMWLNSNHLPQPTGTRSMQAMLLISALLYLGELNVRHLDVRQGIRVD